VRACLASRYTGHADEPIQAIASRIQTQSES